MGIGYSPIYTPPTHWALVEFSISAITKSYKDNSLDLSHSATVTHKSRVDFLVYRITLKG